MKKTFLFVSFLTACNSKLFASSLSITHSEFIILVTIVLFVFFAIVILAILAVIISSPIRQLEKESNRKSLPEYENNDEFDFGHNVKRYHVDGEGDL